VVEVGYRLNDRGSILGMAKICSLHNSHTGLWVNAEFCDAYERIFLAM
jgi:hypothetical protein